jgi:superfamily II DNA or RNA helicase
MLRNYQNKAIELIEENQNKNVALQMPTGAGKTFTFCELAKRHYAEHITRVLILVHRNELLQQAKNSLGERCFLVEAGVKAIPADYSYYVGMVETVNKRLKKLPHFGLVIIDECHIGNFKKMPYFEMESCKVVGVTATPINEYPLANYYTELIQPTNIADLIANKYLLNCDPFGFASDLVGAQKFKVKRGEFDEKQMEDFYSSEKMVKNVIESYWKISPGKKTLIFNVNLNHNKAVYDAFVSEGLNVYSITGETEKKERAEILTKFKQQSDAIICNVGVLTAGFDEPTIETIILNRATKSLSLYLQMIGRGSRISENKERFIVIDLGKNTVRHGYYDDFIDWETYFRNGTKKEKTTVGMTPVKECPTCGFLQHTRKVVCENCGHDFEEERAKQIAEEKVQQLVKLTREKPINIPTDRLFQLAEERQWKPYAVLHKIAEHIIDYEFKHNGIVTEEYSLTLAGTELNKWCEKFNVKNNKWHQDFINKLLNDKRIGRQNTR